MIWWTLAFGDRASEPMFSSPRGYAVPLLSLGGPKRVANLKPRKTIEAIRTMLEFQGVIEH